LKAAALALLDEGGLEACTAPAVAARAGVAVGTIYVRYADKDALIAAALLDMASLGGGAQSADYASVANDAQDLKAFLRHVAELTLRVCRDHRVFLLAVREFVRKSTDQAWRAAFRSAQGRAREVILDAAVARFGDQARGGERALRMALAAIYGTVEVVWLEPVSGVFAEPPLPDAFLDELVEMQLRYLA
jgi:AcrR family transcriptional regulator